MVAARLSCSNTEAFCSLNWLCWSSENLVAYVPGACLHPSHDPRAQVSAQALDQIFRLVLPITVFLPGCCECSSPRHCPQLSPAPSLGPVGWGPDLGGNSPAWPMTISAPSYRTAGPPRLPLLSSSLPVRTYHIFWTKEQVASLMTSLSFKECSHFSAFWCFTRKAWEKNQT